jgi:DNA-binding CsgD family transcriptional regulator
MSGYRELGSDAKRLMGAVMYLGHVERLARYLITPGLTIPDVCKFLVLDTFVRLRASAVYAGEITDDGYIAPIGTFGIAKKVIEDWGPVPLSLTAPLSDAVRKNELVLLRREDAFEKYPVLNNYEGFPEKWSSYLVCPVLPCGVIALTLDTVPEIDPELELFLRTAASLGAIHFNRSQLQVEPFVRMTRRNSAKRNAVLTERQEIIKALMEKGMSNSAIAAEIGYSESLVRHETMAIYSTLNITGRKDLI